MIYYIYKVRRKQTSIRFSRSVPTHRYLRYISWISWNGGHKPPQAGFPHCAPPRAATRARIVFAAAPIPRAAIAAPLPLLPPGGQSKRPPIFPPKNIFLPFFAHLCVSLLPRCSARNSSRVSPAAQPRPAHRSLLRPSHKQKKCGPTALRREPAKSVDLSLKKTHVGTPGLHALASAARTYSLTARIRYCPFSFLLFYKGKEKENRNKFSRFEYIARTHFVRPHDVRDWPVAPRPLKFM